MVTLRSNATKGVSDEDGHPEASARILADDEGYNPRRETPRKRELYCASAFSKIPEISASLTSPASS